MIFAPFRAKPRGFAAAPRDSQAKAKALRSWPASA
jgi:hypothetical protein